MEKGRVNIAVKALIIAAALVLPAFFAGAANRNVDREQVMQEMLHNSASMVLDAEGVADSNGELGFSYEISSALDYAFNGIPYYEDEDGSLEQSYSAENATSAETASTANGDSSSESPQPGADMLRTSGEGERAPGTAGAGAEMAEHAAGAEGEQTLASKIIATVNTGGGSGTEKIAYLTFDDGPSRSITPGILDVLAAEGIKATFFTVAKSGVDDIYSRIIEEGHEIANHSYSHVYSKLYDADNLQPFIDEVTAMHEFILDKFGIAMVSFRFPGGAMGRKAAIVEPRTAILEVMGYRSFDWTVITGDADKRQQDKSAEALAANVLDNTRGREKLIVLMHDSGDKQTTLEALPYIIDGLREQGYQFDVLLNY